MRKILNGLRIIITSIWKTLIRTLAFIRKETFNILRQPRLLLTLVLGPFLILMLFGIGYQNEPRALRTLFVTDQGSELGKQIEDYAPTLGRQLVYMGVVNDITQGISRLQKGDVDLVAVAPKNALDSILAGKRAEFTLYHREIDPVQVGYVKYFGEIYIDELNRRVLRAITEQGQMEAENINSSLETAHRNTSGLEQAINNGNKIAAMDYLNHLANNMDQITLAVGSSLTVLNSIEETMGGKTSSQIDEISNLLRDLQQLTNEMQETDMLSGDRHRWESQVNEINTDFNKLESQIDTFTQLDPDVIVSPFASETISFTEVLPDSTSFYAPAVIALLLQHLAIATAGLSIVQENNIGTMEMFRVAPLSAEEILAGKTISYLIMGGIIGTILAGLMHFGLGVPMLGRWVDYALTLGLLIFSSLGIGFVISLVAQTDSQAVQFSMIVLLLSVFFSGLIMNLSMIWEPVRAISWSIPTTYGIILLREIALRGNPPDWMLIVRLATIGFVLFGLAWLLIRRKLSQN